jgi:hypothetical protein
VIGCFTEIGDQEWLAQFERYLLASDLAPVMVSNYLADLQAFARWLQQRVEGQSRSSGSIRAMCRATAPICKRLSISRRPLSTDACRPSASSPTETVWGKAGDLSQVANALGHTQLKSTIRYIASLLEDTSGIKGEKPSQHLPKAVSAP